MSNAHGKFTWYELMTTDMAGAEAFYANVIGWKTRDASMPDLPYVMFSAGDTPVAGLMSLSPEECERGARPGWIGYIGVDDVDAWAERVGQKGGAVLRAAEDVPAIGRFAVVADPQGAPFVLFKGKGDLQEPAAMMGPGQPGWHELYATDLEPVFAFYAELFGWAKDEALDMGAMGTYQLFSYGGNAVGGMMTKPGHMPEPFWLYYFAVDGIDAAKGRVEAGGGQVLFGPQEVPGGVFILQCLDPQGAMFALVGPRG
ncbi:VOC family protein [Microvirga roseola]|uniref:VOC family protein n=1 Tax=Microvirga roseola TaxID=2883126 RepID=UPI001E4F6BB9|nr:VOC family protein [Microvirga roseola]